MWDLALWGRQDAESGKSTEEPLSEARLLWWASRMRSVVKSLRQTWPDTPIWFRLIHRVGKPSVRSSTPLALCQAGTYRNAADYIGGLTGKQAQHVQDFFTDMCVLQSLCAVIDGFCRRIHQLHELQKAIAISECLPYFDFGLIWEGFQQYRSSLLF